MFGEERNIFVNVVVDTNKVCTLPVLNSVEIRNQYWDCPDSRYMIYIRWNGHGIVQVQEMRVSEGYSLTQGLGQLRGEH